jgi:hypothetical protein
MAHPWGAGVVRWLSLNVLGIQPLDPGFATFDVIFFTLLFPRFPAVYSMQVLPIIGLDPSITRVNGTMPTPKGPISFFFDQSQLRGILTFPPGLVARLCFAGTLASCSVHVQQVPDSGSPGCSIPFSTGGGAVTVTCPAGRDTLDDAREAPSTVEDSSLPSSPVPLPCQSHLPALPYELCPLCPLCPLYLTS